MNKPFMRKGSLVAAVAAMMLSACVSDHSYDVENLKDVDAAVTLFSDGIALPLGQTEPITLQSVLNMSKAKGLDSLLVADSLTGDYLFEAGGQRDLKEVISKMQLEKLRNIDGSSFSKKIEYVIGDIDPSQFTIEGKQFSYGSDNFPSFNLDDIPIPSFKFPDQIIKAGLYKYMPSDLDIGKKIGNVEYSEKIVAINTIKAITDYMTDEQIAAGFQTVVGTLGLNNYNIQNYQKKIQETLDLGENAAQITDIKEFKLKKGSAIKISLAMENVPMTSGTITPDINIDMSSMFSLSGASALSGKLNLSSLTMTKGNGWKNSKEFEITALTNGFPTYGNGKLTLNGNVSIDGAVKISNASSNKSTINSLAGKDMKISIVASCEGVILETMEIMVGGVNYELPEYNLPINISYDLPKGIQSVDKIYFDRTKKFEVTIFANGLDKLVSADGKNHLGVYPYILVTLPDGLEMEGVSNNKIEIAGYDLYDGPVRKTFTIVSVKPKNSDGKLTYNGTITAKVMALASGAFNSKYLPTSEADDITVTARMGCTPALTDYDVTLDSNEMSLTVSESKEFSFELQGMDDFGTFHVNLDGSPKATLTFNVPTTTELSLIARNLVIAIPEMMVIDGSSIPGFDAVKNTITLNGVIPEQIVMPIKYLKVTPQPSESGKTIVKGVYSINGEVAVSKYNVTRVTFDELSGKKVDVKADIPSMQATSITLEGDFNKSLDHDIKDIVILDSKTVSQLPKEIKTIDDICLDGVNAIIELTVNGLPDLDGDFCLLNTTITMPDFIIGESGTNVLTLDNKIPVHNGETIRQTVGITHIKNVQLAGITELKGDLLIRSTLNSHRPQVDVSTLKGKIEADVCVGIGNGEKSSVPGKIVIEKAQVKLEYNYEGTQSLSFGEIPDALQADSVNLALNPNLYLDLTTNFGAPVLGNLTIIPFIGGEALEDETVYINGIELPFSDDCRTLTNSYAIGMNPEVGPDVTVIRTDLSGLVKRIPDSLRIDINVTVDPTRQCVVYPEAEYNCNMQYKFSIPMKFSDEFSLYLNPSVQIDSGTNEALKLATVQLRGTCLTSLPLGVDCNIKLLDATDREIALNAPATLKILPSSDGVKISEQSFNVTLDIKDKENLHAAKLLFAMSMMTTPEISMNKDQTIQIVDLKIVLPNGVTYNFKKKEE